MKSPLQVLSPFLLALFAILASACASGGTPVRSASPTTTVSSTTTGIISCETFVQSLTSTGEASPFLAVMQTYSNTYTNSNSSTQQTIRYLAVQPKNTSDEAVVFFNGTSQITPDWPVAMLTDGTNSLCDDSALVFSDYPGIGDTDQPLTDDFTFDHISDNVYHLLTYLDGLSEFEIASVHPTGWSLGSLSALKFTALAIKNSDFQSSGMSIGKLFLIATKAGGDIYSSTTVNPQSCTGATVQETDYPCTGGQAMCVTSVLNEMFDLDQEEWATALDLKNSLVGVMFPYLYASDSASQAPYGSGDPSDICAVTLDGDKVSAMCNLEASQSVESPCDASSTSSCSTTLKLYHANREEIPYRDQIGYEQFHGQRRLNFTYDYGTCESAYSTSWTSSACYFNPSQTSSDLYDKALIVNGSPCTSISVASEDGTPAVDCPGLYDSGIQRVYIFNGQEDVFIRHDYGEALCKWLNTSEVAPCTLNTYEDTGHGVMYDYGSDIFTVIYNALNTSE